jgi:hypothetical protein
LTNGSGIKILQWVNESSVTRVYASILNMLRDEMHDHLTVLRHSIHLYLLCLLDVLREDDEMFA